MINRLLGWMIIWIERRWQVRKRKEWYDSCQEKFYLASEDVKRGEVLFTKGQFVCKADKEQFGWRGSYE